MNKVLECIMLAKQQISIAYNIGTDNEQLTCKEAQELMEAYNKLNSMAYRLSDPLKKGT